MATTFGIILYPDSITYNSIMSLGRIIHAYDDNADIAWIWHDPEPTPLDVADKKTHLHLMVSSRSTLSMEKFQELFTISGHCIKKINSKPDFIRYLVHRTPDSRNKIQYDLSALHSNFDIQPYFKSIFNNTISEPDMVIDIATWAVRNNAYYLQVYSYVKKMGYPWQKFRMNFPQIQKAIDELRTIPNSELLRLIK